MPKKTTSVKKRKTTRTRAKKPKVKLAKNKVALFCGLVCGICVLAIGLSVVLNQGEKQDSQKAEVVAKAEPVPKTEKKAEKSMPSVQTQPIKQQEKQGKSRDEIKEVLLEKFGEKNPDVKVM